MKVINSWTLSAIVVVVVVVVVVVIVVWRARSCCPPGVQIDKQIDTPTDNSIKLYNIDAVAYEYS